MSSPDARATRPQASEATPSSAAAGIARDLPRVLGIWSAASILIGSIIGSGVFVKPAAIAQSLPSPGWILVCWIASGLLALVGSLVFAELGSYYPRAGGQYTYLRESFGDLAAFLFGWTRIIRPQKHSHEFDSVSGDDSAGYRRLGGL